jgi:adenylate cyclase
MSRVESLIEVGTVGGSGIRTFLIADVRGYTRLTRERGDAAAARLTRKLAYLASDAVEARGGGVIELRGDEALAVFDSAAQAVRAAVEFQATCGEEAAAEPDLPLGVGIGIDVGEAVPVGEGYRGAALNSGRAAVLAGRAGQILVTARVVDVTGALDGSPVRASGGNGAKGLRGTGGGAELGADAETCARGGNWRAVS